MLKLEAKTGNEQIILDYLNENASEMLAEKINSGKKTLSQCWSYIESEALKMVKKRSGMECVALTSVAVFGWAIHFFEEDSIDGKKFDTKPIAKVSNNKPKPVATTPPTQKSEPTPVPEKVVKPKAKTAIEGQMSMFDF